MAVRVSVFLSVFLQKRLYNGCRYNKNVGIQNGHNFKRNRNGRFIFDFSPILKCQGCRKWGAKGALAPPIFSQTVNPILTSGADYAHHSTTSPPGFSNLATALIVLALNEKNVREEKVFLLWAKQYSYRNYFLELLSLQILLRWFHTNFSFLVSQLSKKIVIDFLDKKLSFRGRPKAKFF